MARRNFWRLSRNSARDRDNEAAKGEAKSKHEAAVEKKNKDREVSQCNAACI